MNGRKILREAGFALVALAEVDVVQAALAKAGGRITVLQDALEAVSAIRPANWEDADDPEQVAAWKRVDAALAVHRNAYGEGK